MSFDLKALVAARMGENYELHARHLNPTLVEVQRITGFDRVYTRAEGAYLYDAEGNAYLDFLSGYSVYNMGRNHPVVKQAIRDVLDLDLPNLVQMDCSLLSWLLAEKLLAKTPHLDAIFFCNSGTEAIEGALKFARAATGRAGIVSLHSGYHGLSYGSLSVTGIPNFQEGFGPLMADTARVRLGDLDALERLLRKRKVAAFLVEPVQGKGVKFPKNDFFIQAQALCRKYETLFICDEVQTGLGRTGKWWGFEHWNLEPDIITVAKSLSGGFVPCGAIITRRAIYQKVFSRLDRCVVHSSTFGRNNLAMACGLASLAILEGEKLIENAARIGNLLLERLDALRLKHTFLKEVRGKGLMIAIEFHEPSELGLKMAWRLLHKIDKALFPQLVIVPLLSKHRVLTQVAGHNMDVIKILPPLMIGEPEVDYFVKAFEETLTGCRRLPGPMLELAMNTARRNQNGRRSFGPKASRSLGSAVGAA
ncbi:MAG TPA: aspartate aminotransferase family protein [Chthoniobacterales bacterium]|nr:aspartate aminotransferase family protein [Chthoniobacterales bacterium]